jgi:hypothetical protein
MGQVEAYISGILDNYENLKPREIYRGSKADNGADNKTYSGNTVKDVIIWQYLTLYTEVFVIEEY